MTTEAENGFSSAKLVFGKMKPLSRLAAAILPAVMLFAAYTPSAQAIINTWNASGPPYDADKAANWDNGVPGTGDHRAGSPLSGLCSSLPVLIVR